MIAVKKRVLFAILGVLIVWPLLHIGLVARLDLDPWGFCGFAKYATPVSHQRVYMIELRGDKEVHLHNSWLADDTQDVYRKYQKQRSFLGTLAPPHALAEALLAERPDIEGLKIIVKRDVVSPRTFRTVERPGTAFIYRR